MALLPTAPLLWAQQPLPPQFSAPPPVPPASATQVPAAAAALPAHISGTVTDAQGALVAGARLQLAGPSPQHVVSGSDGRFRFDNVVAGAFTVTVDAPGFSPLTVPGTVLPEQRLEMPPFALQPATVSVSVDAETPEQMALEQLHTEEQQRLLGVFPNFFVSYSWTAPPLTPKQKFTLAWRNTIDPGNLLLVGTSAGFQQADNAFPGYRQGAKGYGRRYGANLGNLVSGTFLGGAIYPVLFHQDPRYFYKGTGTFRSRFLYAISTAVICRGDNGHRQPAFASVLGDLTAGAISNLYYAPSDRQGAKLTFENGLLGIAGDAMNNVFQEFILPRFTTKSGAKNPKP